MPAADAPIGRAGRRRRRRRRSSAPAYRPPVRATDVKSNREMAPAKRAARRREAAPRKPYPLLRQGRPGNRVFEGPRTRAREDVYRRQQGRRDEPRVERLRRARTQAEKRDILVELIAPHVREGRAQGRSGYGQLLARLNQRDRATVRKAAQREQRANRRRERRADRVDPNWRNRQARVGRGKPDVEVAGIPVEAALEHVTAGAQGQAAARLARGGYDAARLLPTLGVNLGRATVEDPGAVAKSSARTAKEMITGLPQAAKMLVTDPGSVVEGTVADYKTRYGLLLRDPKKFRKAVKSEYGLTPFALDIGAAAVPAGYAGTALATTSPALRALRAAESRGGRVGSVAGTVRHATTEQRPNLRFSGGQGGVVRQRRSGNLFKAVMQDMTDTRRRGKADKVLKRHGWATDGTGRVLRDEKGRPLRAGSATPQRRSAMLDALQPGEVPAFYSLRENTVTRKLTGRRQRAIGEVKGRSRLWMLSHRGRVLKEVDDQLTKLDANESRALHATIALGLPAAVGKGRADAVRALEKRRDDIIAERAAAEQEGVPTVLEETNDNLATINAILDDPDRHLTPRLREVATELIKIQKRENAADAGLYSATAIAGQMAAQAQHLGITRRGNPEPYLRMLRRMDIDQAKADKDTPARVSYEELGFEIARAEPEDRKQVAASIARQEKKLAKKADKRWRSIRDEVRELRGIIKNRDARKTGLPVPDSMRERLARLEAEERQAKLERDVADDRARAAKRIKNVTGKPEFPRDFEGIDEWQARVETAARDAGLEEPGYWASTPRPVDEMSLRTVGGGRLTGKVRHRQGELFARGIETEGPEVFRQGIEKSIKRRFTWNLVGKNIETHAFAWSLNNGKGLTATEMKRLMDREGFDPDEIAFINTGGAWKTLREDPESAELDSLDPEDSTNLGSILDDAFTDYATIRTEAQIVQRGREGFDTQAQNRYYAAPKDVVESLQGAARMDGTTSRVLELVLRQKPARIMLGLANTGWLAFQIMSNGFLAGLASSGRIFSPKHWRDSARWWKSLDPEAREQLEMYLGIGHFHKYEQRRLGGVKGETGKFVAAWRGFRQTQVMRSLHKANPIDLMFKADEAQNNFFRRVLFTSAVKRAAARDMGRNWRGMARSQDTLMRAFEKAETPEEHMEVLTKHAREIEDHAKKVNDFLGNYVTYSPAERQLLARTVMFYGFLRFSLRFTFYTMPVEHPVMAAIGSTMGRLGADEIKKLMGIGEGLPPELAAAMRRRESLPTRVLANIWLGDREDIQSGRAMSMALSRMNPALNQVLGMETPSQAFGLFSPVMQSAVNQMLAEETFTGKPWRINPREDINVGKSPPKDPTQGYYGSIFNLLDPGEYLQAAVPGGERGAQRNRILMRDLLGLAAPYRMTEKLTLKGSQADTSLPWDPIPMRYRDPDTRKKIAKSERIEKELRGPIERQVAQELLPVLPKHDVYPDIRLRDIERLQEEAVQRQDAYRTTPKRSKRKRRREGGWDSWGGGGGEGGSSGWGSW